MYRDKKIELSNSITYSYTKKYITFEEYINLMEKEKTDKLEDILKMEAGQTWYNFGGNSWPFVEQHYIPP